MALTLAMVLACGGLVTVAVAWLAVDLALASGRAATAADAAALAAVAASPLAGGDGRACPAAAALAAANGATVERCLAAAEDGWPLRAEIHVRARAATPWLRALAPPLRARAAAMTRPPRHPQPTPNHPRPADAPRGTVGGHGRTAQPR